MVKVGGFPMYLDCRKTPLLFEGATPEIIFAEESQSPVVTFIIICYNLVISPKLYALSKFHRIIKQALVKEDI